MCYRYAIVAGQKTFATGIRKWSKHLTDFPTLKFKTIHWEQQWRAVLMDIYSHLCLADVSVKTALITTGPRPFKLHCLKPWGCVPNDPDTSTRANIYGTHFWTLMVYSNISNSFINITNSFGNITKSFLNILNSFINIPNWFINISNSISNISKSDHFQIFLNQLGIFVNELVIFEIHLQIFVNQSDSPGALIYKYL